MDYDGYHDFTHLLYCVKLYYYYFKIEKYHLQILSTYAPLHASLTTINKSLILPYHTYKRKKIGSGFAFQITVPIRRTITTSMRKQ